MLNGSLAAQQKSWRLVEKFRGQDDLSLEDTLRLPTDPALRAELDWLRAVLRHRGQCCVLELGTGRGWASRALAVDGHRVVATDILDDSQIGLGCALRQRRHLGLNFDCVLTGAECLPFQHDSFDCVFCFATLRHIPDLERVFREVSRVLHPGGLFVALHEPFRGSLTTQSQRLQDCFTRMLARWWLVGELPGSPDPEVLHIRNSLGLSLHEVCRRVHYCRALGRAAGLETLVLPTPVALSLTADLKSVTASLDGPGWLEHFCRAYALSRDRLLDCAKNAALQRQLLAHWILVGNIEGVLLASKGGQNGFQQVELLTEPDYLRQLDPLLLSCGKNGFVPIYGVYGAEADGDQCYHWLQPEAGFLVSGAPALELGFACPPGPYCIGPVRIELRLEAERQPLWVSAIVPGQSTTARIPFPVAAARQASLLVRLTANFGFIPSDFHPGESHDTRLLSIQLRKVRY
jgi:SAM-dependent methyltransferase